MKKIILFALCLFQLNQSFCQTDYFKLMNNITNKTAGILGLLCGGYLLIRSCHAYDAAWNLQCKIKNFKQHDQLTIKHDRNENLIGGSICLAFSGLFFIASYRGFTNKV